MADEKSGIIHWYMPEIRTILPLDDYNIPRTLKQFYSKVNYEIKFDADFLSVVKGCAARNITWITDKLISAYLNLWEMGNIHTVEVYEQNKLVGGLYGITFRGAFFGESMFSKVTQASKIALWKLIEHLNEKGFVLLDVQYLTEHLKMFGAREISISEFNGLLQLAYQLDCTF
jgi:leucyl/phenylalanyl-tRNA--protein transferase